MSIGIDIGNRLGTLPDGLTLAEICRATGRAAIDEELVSVLATLGSCTTSSAAARLEFVDQDGRAHEIAIGVIERASLGHFFPDPTTGSPVDDPAERLRLRFDLAVAGVVPSTFSSALGTLSS